MGMRGRNVMHTYVDAASYEVKCLKTCRLVSLLYNSERPAIVEEKPNYVIQLNETRSNKMVNNVCIFRN